MALYTRGASAAMLAIGFVDWMNSMRIGYGSPVSMARRTVSPLAVGSKPRACSGEVSTPSILPSISSERFHMPQP